jgi:hypothetical protein
MKKNLRFNLYSLHHEDIFHICLKTVVINKFLTTRLILLILMDFIIKQLRITFENNLKIK